MVVVLQNFSIIQTSEKSRDFRDAWLHLEQICFHEFVITLISPCLHSSCFQDLHVDRTLPQVILLDHYINSSLAGGLDALHWSCFQCSCEFCGLMKDLQVEASCSEPCPSQGSPSFPWVLVSIRSWREALYLYFCYFFIFQFQLIRVSQKGRLISGVLMT